MDRVNWVDGRYTSAADMNLAPIAAEAAIDATAAAAVAGVVNGCIPVAAAADYVAITAGQAWDSAGRRLVFPDGGTPVDFGGIDRPAAGQYRWLAWWARYRQVEDGSMTDVAGRAAPAYYRDAADVGVAQGAAFAARGRNRPTASADIAARPAIPAGAVGLGYSLLDSTTALPELIQDSTLLRVAAPRPVAPILLVGALRDAADSTLDDRLRAALAQGRRRYLFGGGWVKVQNSIYPILYAAADKRGLPRVWYSPATGVLQSYGVQNNVGAVAAVLWAAADYGPIDPGLGRPW